MEILHDCCITRDIILAVTNSSRSLPNILNDYSLEIWCHWNMFFGTKSWQAIIWFYIDPFHWCIYESSSLNESTPCCLLGTVQAMILLKHTDRCLRIFHQSLFISISVQCIQVGFIQFLIVTMDTPYSTAMMCVVSSISLICYTHGCLYWAMLYETQRHNVAISSSLVPPY